MQMENSIVVAGRSSYVLSQALLKHYFSTEKGEPTLFFFQGNLYEWNAMSRRWESRTFSGETSWLNRFLWNILPSFRYINQDEEEVSVAPYGGMVKDVKSALLSACSLDKEDGLQAPFWMPGSKEKDSRDLGWVVSFDNVLFDVAANEVWRDRDRGWFDPFVLDVDYDPEEVECPVWMEKLEEWSQGDESWIELLQRVMGYILLPHRRYERWLLMYGATRGGKGVIRDVMKEMVGKARFVERDMDALVGAFGTSGLEVAKVLCVPEGAKLSSSGGTKMGALLKNIVGRDGVFINRKYVDGFDAVVPAFPVVQSNEMLQLADKSGSLSGKMLMLPFHVSFLGREDYELSNKLRREMPAITMWALEGARKLYSTTHEERWPVPTEVAGAIDEFSLMNHPMQHFVEDRFMKSNGSFVSTDLLWSMWKNWCEENGLPIDFTKRSISIKVKEGCQWNLMPGRKGKRRGLKGLAPKLSETP